MNSNVKTAIFWVVIICLAVLLWAVVKQGNRAQPQQPIFSELMKKVTDGEVESATVNSTTGEVTGKYRGSDVEFRSNVPSGSGGVYEKLVDKMLEKGVKVTAQKE